MMPAMPHAAVLHAPRSLRVEERPRPVLDGPYVRVRVRAAGVCGTDLALWTGAYRVPLPRVPGHEWAGDVVEAGPGVDPAWTGRRVTAEINAHCAAQGFGDTCPACARGLVTHCLRRAVTGIVHADGAFQEEVVVPAANLHALPPGLSYDAAVFVEPLAAALHTFRLAPVAPGEHVVVLGGGRLGLLIALVARALGADVLVVARSAAGCARLAALGLDAVPHDVAARRAPEDPLAAAASELRDRVLIRSGGLGADVVVEATGHPDGLAAALDLVRPRGAIALKSTPGTPVPAFNLTRAVVDEVRLVGSRCGAFDAALGFLEAHALPLDGLITARFALDRVAEAFEAAAAGGKVVVRP